MSKSLTARYKHAHLVSTLLGEYGISGHQLFKTRKLKAGSVRPDFLPTRIGINHTGLQIAPALSTSFTPPALMKG